MREIILSMHDEQFSNVAFENKETENRNRK
jgi:hypothetical protein